MSQSCRIESRSAEPTVTDVQATDRTADDSRGVDVNPTP